MAAKVFRPLKQLGVATVVAVTIPTAGHYIYKLQVASSHNPEPKLLKVTDLPLYGSPEKGFKVLPEEIGVLRSNISSLREGTWSMLDSLKYEEKKERVQRIIDTGVAHTQSTIEYVRTETGTIQRVGIITVSGLGGIILGYKGGYLRKAAFGTFAALAAASLCYPKETIDLTTDTYNNFAQSVGLPEAKSDKDKKNKS